jgi:ParB family chromosome partitioning protein
MSKESQNGLVFSESEVREIPLDQIEPDKKQLRKEFKQDELEALAESIKENGLIQPILVTTGKGGKYQIVDGERRWRAHTMLARQAAADSESPERPIKTIRAIYVDGDSQLLGILGNIARNSYNAMETADALALVKKMLGEAATDSDVAKHIGRSRTIVVEYNSLTKLPKKIQDKARLDSCVPFNKLKSLAAKRKLSEDEKIAAYEELHKKYSASKDEPPKKADKKAQSTRETRSVVAVRKKLDSMKDTLSELQISENVDPQEKDNLLKSLQEIIDAAQSVQQKMTKE